MNINTLLLALRRSISYNKNISVGATYSALVHQRERDTPKDNMDEIVLGDCLSHIDSLPEDTFFISDPPYNQSYHYDEYKDRLAADEYASLLIRVFGGRKAVVILYPEDTIQLLGGGRLGNVSEVVSWVYPSNTAKQHRLISWWNCKPDMRRIPQPYKNPTDKRIAKRIEEGKSARSYDWWEINQVKNVSKVDNPHPCPIPYELAKRVILATTNEGDTVCDPFAGSGTVLKAAQDIGRHFIGYDISERYVKYAHSLLYPMAANDNEIIAK